MAAGRSPAQAALRRRLLPDEAPPRPATSWNGRHRDMTVGLALAGAAGRSVHLSAAGSRLWAERSYCGHGPGCAGSCWLNGKGLGLYRFRFAIVIAGATAAATLAGVPAAARVAAGPAVPANVDVSQRHLNESEEAIAVNPANPSNIVMVTNVGHAEAGLTAGMFEGVSFDGGKTWATKLIGLGGSDPLGDACCGASPSFDRHANLFMTYLYQVAGQVPVALSTDGGLTFHPIANTAKGDLPAQKASGANRQPLRL